MDNSYNLSKLRKINYAKSNHLQSSRDKILVIEDRVFSRMTTVDILSTQGYEVDEINDNGDVFNYVVKTSPDLIILDLLISQLDSFELCQQLKEDPRTCLIPIIFTGVSDDNSLRLKCLQVGGDDLMTKPLDRMLLITKVKSLIKQKRLNENLNQTEQVLFAIAKAIESRYSPGQNNPLKLVNLSKKFSLFLELTSVEIENLVCAAYLHDIGTVLIPDAIILKQETLNQKEREILKQHVLLGEEICQPLKNKQGVIGIIRHHHERRDGSGYPDGLVGDEIPWLAQIFQILDIYCALTSERPHKKALSSEDALNILKEETIKGWRNGYIVEQFTLFINQYSAHKWQQAS